MSVGGGRTASPLDPLDSVLAEGDVAWEQVRLVLGAVEVEIGGWRGRRRRWPAGPVLGVEHGWHCGAEAVEQAQVFGLGGVERDEAVVLAGRDLDEAPDRGDTGSEQEQQVDAGGGDVAVGGGGGGEGVVGAGGDDELDEPLVEVA